MPKFCVGHFHFFVPLTMNTRNLIKSTKSAKPDTGSSCSCLNHDIFINDVEKFSLRSRAYFRKRREFNELVNRNLVDRRATYICTACLEFAIQNLLPAKTVAKGAHTNFADPDDGTDMDVDETGIDESNEENTDNNDTDVDAMDEDRNTDSVNDILSLEEEIDVLTTKLKSLKWKNFSLEVKKSLCSLAFSLGDIIKSEIDSEKHTMAAQCSSFEALSSIDSRQWYNDRNPLLKDFLLGCTGVGIHTTNEKKFNSCLHAIEQVIYTKNNNIVTPFSFQRNLMTYVISKSKQACQLAAGWEGSGSYTKVISILNAPSEPLQIEEESDITITFDNEQKVGHHSGMIREGSKQPISIITTVATIGSRPRSTFQFEEEYRRGDVDFRQAITLVNDLETHYRHIMRQYRSEFIDEMIETVIQEHYVNDYVDKALEQNEKRVCPSCCETQDEVFEVCPSCHFNTSFYDHSYDKYHRTKACGMDKPVVENAEPTLLNPSSYETVKTVLENIEKQCFTSSSERKWVSVMCDGNPYHFAAIMQDTMKVCSVCEDFIHVDDITEHQATHENEKVSFSIPFPNFVLRPGPGHIEMNMARKLLSFLWVPFMKDLAVDLGFRTKNAQDVFRLGIDHHRSRQVLETCLIALTKELLVPYVRSAVSSNEVPTSNGYIKWYEDCVENQKYAFIFHVTFSYLLSFHLYNEAVRKNNHDNMMAARITFSPLFFIGQHYKYQRLLVRDLCERVNYSEKMLTYATMTESYTVSGEHNKGQGGDFIHEEVNKSVKSFLPASGMPSKQTWQNIIRKAKTLDAMKTSILASSGYGRKKEKKRPKKFEQEITMVRKQFRERYLVNYDADENLRSLSGELLDESLCDFTFTAKENYESYKEDLASTSTYGSKLMPVFVTKEERIHFEKIENKTIKEIKEKILEFAKKMPNQNEATALFIQPLNRKSNKKKDVYIAMYYEAQKLLDTQIALIQLDSEKNQEEVGKTAAADDIIDDVIDFN